MGRVLLNLTVFTLSFIPSFVSCLLSSSLNQSIRSVEDTCLLRNSIKFKVSLSNECEQNIPIVSEKDKEDIYEQLGYIPSNLVSIAARRGGDIKTPLVLKTYPLNGGASRRKAKAEGILTPFPTLYWFCCKEVGKAVANLERRGYVGKLEERLRDEPGMLEKFVRSHDSYAKERWNSLTDEHQEYILKNERMLKILRNSGIAGTDYELFESSKNASIKCLHAHYGHYRGQIERNSLQQGTDSDHSKISQINIVGQWVHELLCDEYPELIL
jgi:hypothetical protein